MAQSQEGEDTGPGAQTGARTQAGGQFREGPAIDSEERPGLESPKCSHFTSPLLEGTPVSRVGASDTRLRPRAWPFPGRPETAWRCPYPAHHGAAWVH